SAVDGPGAGSAGANGKTIRLVPVIIRPRPQPPGAFFLRTESQPLPRPSQGSRCNSGPRSGIDDRSGADALGSLEFEQDETHFLCFQRGKVDGVFLKLNSKELCNLEPDRKSLRLTTSSWPAPNSATHKMT